MAGSTITLEAEPRNAKEKARDRRRAGRIPCVLYGHKQKSQPIECDAQTLHKVFVKAGESTVIDLQVSGKNVPVLIHQITFDPVTGDYEHVDFFAPDMTKEVHANVPIHITGEAPGVKDLGGVLVRSRDSVEVKCLPKDLPNEILVDISGLAEFHDAITVADLPVPANVKIEEDADALIVVIQPPRKEEEEQPAAAEGAAAEGTEGAEATAEAGAEKKEGEEAGEGEKK